MVEAVKLLTTGQAAKIMGVSITMIHYYIRGRELPAYQKGRDGWWRIRSDDLEKFIRAR